jgi:hypothetical protein
MVAAGIDAAEVPRLFVMVQDDFLVKVTKARH